MATEEVAVKTDLLLAYGLTVSKQERDRVTRIKEDIAKLEGKVATAKKGAGKCRTEARRKLLSISRHTSENLANQKRRDAAKLEEKASGHDERAATLGRQIAGKERQLNSALAALERSEARDAKQAERERKKVLDELSLIEGRRRASQTDRGFPVTLRGSARSERGDVLTERGASAEQDSIPEFDVCLSFAGEQRGYVELVKAELQDRGYNVFYDMDEQVNTWGKDLAEYFDFIYRRNSQVCLMFISKEYAEKSWTRHEKRSALARGLDDEGYVLPVRFDETDLPGLSPTVAYIEASQYAPASLAQLLADRLGPPLSRSSS